MFNVGDEVELLTTFGGHHKGYRFIVARIQKKYDGVRDVLRDKDDWGVYETDVRLVSDKPEDFEFDV